MNTSFIPPAPISDALRAQIYQEFMRDPKENSVRVLSQIYHISMKRVDAILRLKGLENAWLKVRCFSSSPPHNGGELDDVLRLVFKTSFLWLHFFFMN